MLSLSKMCQNPVEFSDILLVLCVREPSYTLELDSGTLEDMSFPLFLPMKDYLVLVGSSHFLLHAIIKNLE